MLRKQDFFSVRHLLSYLFILVSSNPDKDGFLKRVGIEGIPSHGEDVAGLYDVETWLVLVH